MRVDLGGPRAGCSANRVRRLLAGELAASEREQCARHLEGCARCQAVRREVEEEKALLAREVPFELFAAGVAEKLAPAPKPVLQPWRSASRWMPLAAAAAIALVAGAALVRGPATEESGIRSKGAAGVELFVQDAQGLRALGREEKIMRGARIQVVLRPAGRKYAGVVLLEPGETSVIYSGAAVQGALPQSFEWTGAGAATLQVVFADQPIENPAQVPAGADVLQVSLRR